MTAGKYVGSTRTPSSVLDVARLRSMRNAVIGSRTRKSEIVAQGRVPSLVGLLADVGTSDEMRSLAATIVGSLAHQAPPPTLLSLCRADAVGSVLDSIDRLSRRMSAIPPSARFVECSAVTDESAEYAQQLKLLESFLRALRSLLMALADEVAPGTKWERGLGLGAKVGSGSTTPRIAGGSASKSAREVIGWHMADAGFEADGDTRMSSSRFRSAHEAGRRSEPSPSPLLSPHEELVLLARQAISRAFRPEHLRIWLGALFVARLPVATKTLPLSQPGSADQSRASTRPASPAPPSHSLHGTAALVAAAAVNSGPLSRSSSRMSLSSDTASGAAHSLRSSTNSLTVSPMSASQVRILAIVEMVSGTLSSCLAVAIDDPSASEVVDAVKEKNVSTPEDVIAQRRNAVLNFLASDSPYWCAKINNVAEQDEDDGRGRRTAMDGGDLQASFVKRGNSIDGRAMSEREQHDVVMLQPTSVQPPQSSDGIAPDKSVLDVLLEAVECGYAKTQEASLWALTDLARENTETSRKMFACLTPSGMIPTSMLLNLRKDPSAPVRLAAFCCLAHIIKAHPFTARTNECVLSVLVGLMDVPGEVQIAAIFAFARLVADDGELQMLACDQYDCIEKLGILLAKSKVSTTGIVSPAAAAAMAVDGVHPSAIGVADGLGERIREATLMALAALCFQRDEIRRKFVDLSSPPLLPLVVSSLSAPQVGVRIAACRLVRALSRSISILRTSLVDAGVAARLLAILQDATEDAQVRTEAIASICNLVLKFSPMKQVLLEGGGVPKLVELIKTTSDGATRLNALWALKNILYASETSVKTQVMESLGWSYIRELAMAADIDVQEQALNILRNLCSSRETDIEATLRGFGGGDALLDLIEEVIWQRRSDNALEQAAFLLVNLATGNVEHRRLIMGRPNLLDALVFFLNHPRVEVRVAGIWAATNLTQPARTPHVAFEAASRLKTFGFDKRLKQLVDDPERDVSDRARDLMARFEVQYQDKPTTYTL